MEKQNANPTVYNVSDLSHTAFLKGKDSDSDGKSYQFISKHDFSIFKQNSKVFENEEHLFANYDDEVETKESKENVNNVALSPASNKDDFDKLEIFEMIRHLNDPEHPLTLEQLHVTTLENIDIDNKDNIVDVRFTPTIPHCSMATLIGLSIRVKLLRSLPKRFKVRVSITPGTHAQEHAVNKQLNDKERVAAALENSHLLKVVNKCIAHTDKL
mgnify:CR=1 FL=1